jgi:hypothetical protein
MSSDGEVGDALTDAFNDHTLEGLVRLYSPQAVCVAPGGMAEGHEQIAAYYGDMFRGFPDARITLWRKITASGVTLHEWTLTGTHHGPFLMPDGGTLEATGQGIAVRGCSTANMDGDLIVSHQHYFDQLELFASLGVRLNADR